MTWAEFRALVEGLLSTESRLFRVTQSTEDGPAVMPDVTVGGAGVGD